MRIHHHHYHRFLLACYAAMAPIVLLCLVREEIWLGNWHVNPAHFLLALAAFSAPAFLFCCYLTLRTYLIIDASGVVEVESDRRTHYSWNGCSLSLAQGWFRPKLRCAFQMSNGDTRRIKLRCRSKTIQYIAQCAGISRL